MGKLGKAGPNQTSANRWNTSLSTTPKRGRNSPYRDKDWLWTTQGSGTSLVKMALPSGRWLKGGPTAALDMLP